MSESSDQIETTQYEQSGPPQRGRTDKQRGWRKVVIVCTQVKVQVMS